MIDKYLYVYNISNDFIYLYYMTININDIQIENIHVRGQQAILRAFSCD